MDESSIFDNPRTKLEDIQMSIEEVSLDRKSKKPRLNAENHRTIADIKSELQGLRRRIHETKSTYRSKDSRRVPMNETIVKKEPVVDHIINSQSHPLSDRRANVPQPFPMAMEVDRKPFIKPEEPPARHGARALFPAPSSNPPANEPQTIHPWKLESKPRITPPKQPVACSKDPSPSDAEDEDYGNPTIAVDLVNRIGINVPPPIDNEAMDDNGDYYGRGTDLFEGPRASGDEYVIFFLISALEIISWWYLLTLLSLEKFLVVAGNVETFDGNESVDKALKYLELNNLDEKLPGMEVSLMAHQALGVAWMLEKEKSIFLGGCLADEMGLGKVS